ncbi:MAG: Transcriptional regulator, PadR family, partial [uncultured Phycisphaerae bacterium]
GDEGPDRGVRGGADPRRAGARAELRVPDHPAGERRVRRPVRVAGGDDLPDPAQARAGRPRPPPVAGRRHRPAAQVLLRHRRRPRAPPRGRARVGRGQPAGRPTGGGGQCL